MALHLISIRATLKLGKITNQDVWIYFRTYFLGLVVLNVWAVKYHPKSISVPTHTTRHSALPPPKRFSTFVLWQMSFIEVEVVSAVIVRINLKTEVFSDFIKVKK